MDNEKIWIIILPFLVVIACLGAVIKAQNKEIGILQAKCLKTGVATMSYDINTGNSKFVFDVGENQQEEQK